MTPRPGPVSSFAYGSLLNWAGSSSKSRLLANWMLNLLLQFANKDRTRKDQSNTDSIPFRAAVPPEPKRNEAGLAERMEEYRALLRDNIQYPLLVAQDPDDADLIDEIVELMTETVCARRKTTRVCGSDFPAEVVKSRLLKLDAEHIRFVLKCLHENTAKVKNIKQYLLAALFNAPTTMSNYYTSLVNHDMYGG